MDELKDIHQEPFSDNFVGVKRAKKPKDGFFNITESVDVVNRELYKPHFFYLNIQTCQVYIC